MQWRVITLRVNKEETKFVPLLLFIYKMKYPLKEKKNEFGGLNKLLGYIWMPLPISIYTCYTHKAKYHYFVFQSVLILRLINFYVQFHFRSVSFNVLHLNIVPILYYGFSCNVFWLRKCFEAYIFFLHCWMLITSNNFIRLLIESYEHLKCKI